MTSGETSPLRHVETADARERLRRLRDDPSFAAAADSNVSLPTPRIVLVPMIAGLSLAGVFAASVLSQLAGGVRADGTGLDWSFQPDRRIVAGYAAGIVACLVVAAWGVAWRARFRRAPRVAVPAVVVHKRAGILEHRAFYVTLEFEGRPSAEHAVDLDTFSYVLPGDAGVAWFQAGRFVAFRKIAA